MFRIALFGAVVAMVSCQSDRSAELMSGDTVVLERAIKGHELWVRKNHGAAKVRLVGVYTFDARVQEAGDITLRGRQAVDFVTAKADGAPLKILLEHDAPDPRGRYLAFVDVAGADLGALLVQEGYAAVYTEYPFDREADYLAAERPAREGRQGVWASSVAKRRLRALRETWASVRAREGRGSVSDPILEAAP